MEIYIIRHGETTANVERRLQGQMDFPLTDAGIALAKQTGLSLSDVKFDICFTSPLSRAVDTANLVLSQNKYPCPICVDNRLIEVDLGIHQNQLIDGNDFAKQFFANPLKMGTFPGGESIADVIKRTQSFLQDIGSKNYERVLVSTHGCATRCMLNPLYADSEDFWQGHVPYNCSINIARCIDGKFTLTQQD